MFTTKFYTEEESSEICMLESLEKSSSKTLDEKIVVKLYRLKLVERKKPIVTNGRLAMKWRGVSVLCLYGRVFL